jgi:hypothetical protein
MDETTEFFINILINECTYIIKCPDVSLPVSWLTSEALRHHCQRHNHQVYNLNWV